MAELDENHITPETTAGSVAADKGAGAWTEGPVNEIVKTAREAKQGDGKTPADEKRGTWLAAGVGVGIGSAALVAALLYANRDRAPK